MEKIRIGLIQSVALGDPGENRRRAATHIRKATKSGAQIICLEELFATPYFCRTEDRRWFALAESVPGPTTDLFSGLARELGVVLIVPVFEKRSRGLYHNSAAVIDADGRLCGVYRKMHIPDDPGYYEKYYFAPGDNGFPVFETRYAKIGVLICWDQWYPEAARLAALGGAEILFFPTAIGAKTRERRASREVVRSAWRTAQVAHAIANGVWVAAVNRVGIERGNAFWGGSFVAAPDGRIVTEAASREKIIYADCDLDAISRVREEWPFLRDRRIDAYDGLTQRFLH